MSDNKAPTPGSDVQVQSNSVNNKVVKNPVGRPTKYEPEMCQAMIDFFDIPYTVNVTKTVLSKQGEPFEVTETVANDLPTVQAFCHKLGISEDTFFRWVKEKPEFSESYKKARAIQCAMWQSNSLKGLYRDAFTIFLGKNVFKWTDRQDIGLEVSQKQPQLTDLNPDQLRAYVEKVNELKRLKADGLLQLPEGD